MSVAYPGCGWTPGASLRPLHPTQSHTWRRGNARQDIIAWQGQGMTRQPLHPSPVRPADTGLREQELEGSHRCKSCVEHAHVRHDEVIVQERNGC